MTLKYADLIIAVAQGKKVQRRTITGEWQTYSVQSTASAVADMVHYPDNEFRLAPQPVVTWQPIWTSSGRAQSSSVFYRHRDNLISNNKDIAAVLKLTYDPSTGEITAEVEKV